MDEYRRESCIRGYHKYKETWETSIGDELMCIREPSNDLDRYAVATLKSHTVVGHLPRDIQNVSESLANDTQSSPNNWRDTQLQSK